jgi:hypothetical protein
MYNRFPRICPYGTSNLEGRVLSPHKLWESTYDLDIMDYLCLVFLLAIYFHFAKEKEKRKRKKKKRKEKKRGQKELKQKPHAITVTWSYLSSMIKSF